MKNLIYIFIAFIFGASIIVVAGYKVVNQMIFDESVRALDEKLQLLSLVESTNHTKLISIHKNLMCDKFVFGGIILSSSWASEYDDAAVIRKKAVTACEGVKLTFPLIKI